MRAVPGGETVAEHALEDVGVVVGIGPLELDAPHRRAPHLRALGIRHALPDVASQALHALVPGAAAPAHQLNVESTTRRRVEVVVTVAVAAWYLSAGIEVDDHWDKSLALALDRKLCPFFSLA